MIYFVKSAGGLVKIGLSANPRRRLVKMRADSSEVLELLVIIDGGPKDEKALHAQFSHLRVRGEWFNDDGAIGKLVGQLIKGGAEVPSPTKERSYKPGRDGRPSHRDLRALGLSQAYASELAAGKKIPSLATAQRIEGALGYPAGAWRLGETAQNAA